MRTNGHFFDWGFGLAWTALVALIVGTTWLATPMPVQASLFIDPSEITVEDILDAHVDIFSALFDEEWDEDYWHYSLNEPVDGIGIFSGQNHLGQDFTLRVGSWIPIDAETLGLSGEELDQWTQQQLSFAFVTAELATKKAKIPVHGFAASKLFPSGELEWAFLPVYYAPSDHPALSSTRSIDPNQGLIAEEAGIEPQPQETSGEEPNVCVAEAAAQLFVDLVDCWLIYNAAMMVCNAAWNTAATACNNAYNTAISDATSAWQTCIVSTTAVWLALYATCVLFTFGWGLIACLGIAAAIASAAIQCDNTYANAVDTATTTRNSCLAAARGAHAACRNQAKLAYDLCIAQAQTTLSNALTNCD